MCNIITNFECTIQEYTANDIHAYNLLPETKQEIKKLGGMHIIKHKKELPQESKEDITMRQQKLCNITLIHTEENCQISFWKKLFKLVHKVHIVGKIRKTLKPLGIRSSCKRLRDLRLKS